MAPVVCCVCHEAVGQDAPRIGGRAYCATHYARVGNDRSSVWRATIASLAAIILFGVGVALLASLTEPALEGAALVWAGLGLAVIPAVLWMVFFYLQDRLEPEPKRYVLAVALIAALLASAVGIPLVRDLFRVQDWQAQSLAVNLLGSILVVGFVQEFLKWAAVRYSVYLLPEFDERMDGILYGTAAGLGYATMLNINYVVESGGVNLGVGVVRIVVTALAQASFAGITGYFLGRAKFEEEAAWWMPLGLTLAAVLNGLFTVLLGGLTRTRAVVTGQMSTPWYGLVAAAVLAGLTLFVLLALIRRANRLTAAGMQGV